MATPRQAAAALAARKSTGLTSRPSSSTKGGNITKETKKKVNWDDVEAKARREAMWLLQRRKQQQEEEANTPCKASPPKKRQRKTPPKTQIDTPTPPAESRPHPSSHRVPAATTTARELELSPARERVKVELSTAVDTVSLAAGHHAPGLAATATGTDSTTAPPTVDHRASISASPVCLSISSPSPSYSCSSGSSDGTAFSTCAPTSVASASYGAVPGSPLRPHGPEEGFQQKSGAARVNRGVSGGWEAQQGMCLLAAAAVGRALEEAQGHEKPGVGEEAGQKRGCAYAFPDSSRMPAVKKGKKSSAMPRTAGEKHGPGKSSKSPAASAADKSSKSTKGTSNEARAGASQALPRPARKKRRKKALWRPNELRFIVDRPANPVQPVVDNADVTEQPSCVSSAELSPNASRKPETASMGCAKARPLCVPFLPSSVLARKRARVDGESVSGASGSERDNAVGTASDPAYSRVLASDGIASDLTGAANQDRSSGNNDECVAVKAASIAGAGQENCGERSIAEADTKAESVGEDPIEIGGQSRLVRAEAIDNRENVAAYTSTALPTSAAADLDSTAKSTVDVAISSIAGSRGEGTHSHEIDERNTTDAGDQADEDNADDYDYDEGGDNNDDDMDSYAYTDAVYDSLGATDWSGGPFALRWLPTDALAALQAAGAAAGMDQSMLEAAAVAVGEAPSERPREEVPTKGRGTKRKEVVVRKARKKRKMRPKRETHVLVSESEGEEPGGTSSTWRELEEAAREEAKALLLSRKCGMFEVEDDENQHWVRRSVRAAGASQLDSPHVVKLLAQIRANDPEVEVLKLHHYLGPDVNTAVIDAVLEAVSVNTNCQALYIQNFNEGFRDEQVGRLAAVLRQGRIWCLNAGENYKVDLATWWEFVEEIKSTNVTHAYLSEHVITPELKNAMRDAIRDNRAKHTRHKSASNLDVIRRCTNMWWNPINSRFLQAELKLLDMDYDAISCVPSPVVSSKRVPCSLHGKGEGTLGAIPPPLNLLDALSPSRRGSSHHKGFACSPRGDTSR